MKKTLLTIALLTSSTVFANTVSLSITEQARPGVPQIRWTTVDVLDATQSSYGKLTYEIHDWRVKVSWTTNQGVQGTCSVTHNENQDNSTDWNEQVNKRRYNVYRELLTNLKPGQKLLITSSFDNTATCNIAVTGQVGK